MKVYDCEQGSKEWIALHAGVCTASQFSMVRAKVNGLTEQQRVYVQALLDGKPLEAAKAIAKYKSAPTAGCIERALDLKTTDVGEWSDKAKNYAFRLAVERIAGEAVADDYFETYAMRRGKELEEDCRLLHEKALNKSGEYLGAVELVGFITTEDNKFGCSPDAVVPPKGGGEYKCFYGSDSVRPILLDNNWGEIQDQGQGSIWLTGADWWDYCLYFPALKSIGKEFRRIRVARDAKYIEKLEADLLAFDKLVTENEAKIRAA